MRPKQLFNDLQNNFSDIIYSGLMVNDEMKYDNFKGEYDADEYESIVSRLYFIAMDLSKNIQYFITQYREGKYLYFLKVTTNLWLFIFCESDSFAKLHFYIQFLLSDTSLELEEEHEHSESTIDELNSAKRIQELMLPDLDQALKAFSDYHHWDKPKDTIGGDFYWTKNLRDETWIVVGDCTGHGMEGALSSVSIMSILNQVFTKQISPHMLIKSVHQGLNDIQKQKLTDGYGIGCEMMAMHFNHKTNELTYSGTGLPLYHFSDGNVKQHRTKSAGFIPEIVIKYLRSRKLILNPGDGIFTHSDGLIDQLDTTGRRIRRKNVLKALREVGTVNDQNTKELLERHKGDEPQTDDIISLFVKI